MCVAGSAVEGVDVSGGGESFRFPRSNYGIGIIFHPTFRLWAVTVPAAKLSNQGEMYGLPPLKLDNYPIFVVYIRVAIKCQRWNPDEVVAQEWDMCYVVQFYVRPSVVRAKIYVKVTVTCD